MYTDAEFRLATERNLKYRGTARVDLNRIVPHPTIARNIDSKNVRRLCGIFEKDGCRRLSLHNHVTVIVSRQNLNSALHAAGVGAHELMTNSRDRYPHLHFSTGQVHCLHGQHRLKAGEEFFFMVFVYFPPPLNLFLLYCIFLSLLSTTSLPSFFPLVRY